MNQNGGDTPLSVGNYAIVNLGEGSDAQKHFNIIGKRLKHEYL